MTLPASRNDKQQRQKDGEGLFHDALLIEY
jgi:hypothetical protein